MPSDYTPDADATSLDRLAADDRVTVRRGGPPKPDSAVVVYWMQRAQRAFDNPALDAAIDVGNLLRKPVVAFFAVHPFVESANLRHYRFLVDGIADLAAGLRRRRVGFAVRAAPDHRLLPFLDAANAALVIGDENPLRQPARWRDTVSERVRIPFWTVDADVVVPSRLLEKEQYAARTIRPRIHRRLAEFLVAPRAPRAAIAAPAEYSEPPIAPEALLASLPIDRGTAPVDTFRGGLAQARLRLRRFIRQRLEGYDAARNHPESDGTSELSPYLHFGQIGPREVALAVRDSGAAPHSVEAFLEQLIVRRELAVNFVRFNAAYDRLEGCEAWARQTLRRHRFDARPFLYSHEQFDAGDTHDPLWNAAQRQMVTAGWMHGYVRMYWAKKILEWSDDPAQALATAIALNDRYEVDGRDPNGYANIAWAIGGKHDRPWPTRPVFGTVRSMTYASTRRKFDADAYIARWGGR